MDVTQPELSGPDETGGVPEPPGLSALSAEVTRLMMEAVVLAIEMRAFCEERAPTDEAPPDGGVSRF